MCANASMSIILALMACALLTGCDEKGNSPDSKVIVGILSPALTSTFHVTLSKAAVVEGESYGWKVENMAPDRETNFAAQIDMMQTLVRRKVAAISVCAINDSALVGAVEEANKAGIPVFVHNSLNELPGGEVEACVGYNQREAGRLCGQYVVGKLQEKYGAPKGEVFLLLGVPGYHSTERSSGFKDALKEYPDIHVIAETPANWERQQAMNVALAALKSNPDLDAFFGCSDAMAQGAAQAASEAGVKAITIGIDGNPDTFKDIKGGVVTATCAVFPDKMGQIVMQTIQKRLAGQPIEKKVETPIEIIDAANVDKMLTVK